MQLKWMGEYREMVEALIHYCNIYASVYKIERMTWRGVSYSYSQIQVLEYLLENEEKQQNMSFIASRLGITRSNFTKIAGKLVFKGLLEKTYMPGSRKDVLLTVSPLGKDLYEEYSRGIYERHFSRMFEEWSGIPEEYREHFRDSLYAALHGSGFRKKG